MDAGESTVFNNQCEAVSYTMVTKQSGNLLRPHFNRHGCREQFIGAVARHVRYIDGTGAFKARVIVSLREPNVEKLDRNNRSYENIKSLYERYEPVDVLVKRIEKAISIYNLFEKSAGWPLTRMHDVETINTDNIVNAWSPGTKGRFYNKVWDKGSTHYVVGSKRWMKSPYMVSLYLLILKASYMDVMGDHSSIEKLIPSTLKRIERLRKYSSLEQRKRLPYRGWDNIASYTSASIKYWPIVISGYHRLFGKGPAKDYWLAGNFKPRRPIGCEGIHQLCIGQAALRGLAERFEKLCGSEGIE
jgi:hypothetical protein